MIEVGQVLHLYFRFNNYGHISTDAHPYLIYRIDLDQNFVELIQLDSIKKGEGYMKASTWANIPITIDQPYETVIEKSSYAQTDNEFKVEYFKELERFRKTKDKLSDGKMNAVFNRYKKNKDKVPAHKKVYMTKEELLRYNR